MNTNAVLAPDMLVRRFAEQLQSTAAASEKVYWSAGLSYDRIAARFYEEIIMGLKKELAKYQAHAHSMLSAENASEMVYTGDEPILVDPQYRAKLNTFVSGAKHFPEEI